MGRPDASSAPADSPPPAYDAAPQAGAAAPSARADSEATPLLGAPPVVVHVHHHGERAPRRPSCVAWIAGALCALTCGCTKLALACCALAFLFVVIVGVIVGTVVDDPSAPHRPSPIVIGPGGGALVDGVAWPCGEDLPPLTALARTFQVPRDAKAARIEVTGVASGKVRYNLLGESAAAAALSASAASSSSVRVAVYVSHAHLTPLVTADGALDGSDTWTLRVNTPEQKDMAPHRRECIVAALDAKYAAHIEAISGTAPNLAYDLESAAAGAELRDVDLRTHNGHIKLTPGTAWRVRERVHAVSDNGAVSVADVTTPGADLYTSNGAIAATISDAASVDTRSSNGRISLTLADVPAGASVRAVTSNGRIDVRAAPDTTTVGTAHVSAQSRNGHVMVRTKGNVWGDRQWIGKGKWSGGKVEEDVRPVDGAEHQDGKVSITTESGNGAIEVDVVEKL